MSQWIFELTPLTPLHIGSGETLDPYEYVIFDDKLYQFSPEQLLMKLSYDEQERFVDLVENNLKELQHFLQQRKELVTPLCPYPIPVTDAARQTYNEQLRNPRADLTLYPFIKTTRKPFIPGSSLKGAIRTAMLYNKAPKPVKESNGKRLEAQNFGYARVVKGEYRGENIGDDPFKSFKISDSQTLPGVTLLALVKVHTKRRNGVWREDISMLREIALSKFFFNFEQRFIHFVQLKEEFSHYDTKLMKFEMDKIITVCREFYGYHLREEQKYLANLPPAAAFYDQLIQWEKGLHDNSFIVRFGWGSGFDAVTVNYARERPERKRSRRLAEGGVPLGWAQIKVKQC
ncbi:MAG: type III-A CRISPR-associated RAMP protein Csm5 [Dehalococcoidales bacterium]|nr:type III-A CRISPR-associated RAMP protein Csm5 [Dehalococcoidales bacterium]